MFGKTATLGRVGGVALLIAACSGARDERPASTPEPKQVEVGYGSQRADGLTGAVTSLSNEEIREVRPLRIEEVLRGRVAGLQVVPAPGGGYTLRIRGTNSLLNDQPPLIVVNGEMIAAHSVPTTLAGLVAEDIRQVNVLRDIASTSIYGSRGAGGVIVITTRR